MRRLFTLTLGCILFLNFYAQTFSDNFDSYNVGDYIGNVSDQWTTWSGSTGGSEDAQVSDAQASSAPHSAYFYGNSSGGGPQDVVLPFGGEHNTGVFTFECSFFVETDNGAYFNLQANETIGEQWAIDCYMVNDGNIYFNSDGNTVFESTYPINEWFDLKLEINLSLNRWKLYIDDELEGIWANPINQVASLDIYPVNPSSMGGNNNCSFYIDNVSYNVEEYVLPDLNLSVMSIQSIMGLAGQERYPTAYFKNVGNNPITSFDYSLTYGVSQVTGTVADINLESLAELEMNFEDPITLLEGENDLTVAISNVNGGIDDDPDDDNQSITIDPLIPAAGKIVVGEEGTGTWCGWCPRGAVFMDYMEEYYHGFWAGIAVHNGDPMTNAVYDAGIGSLIDGYPSALVDRGADIDPNQFEAAFLEKIVVPPAATLTNGAEYDEASGELLISAEIVWNNTVDEAWRVACVIIEDSVTGTGSGYNQANYYSGGGNGEMGGFEALPNPVPADQMIYRHVAREIINGFNGETINGIQGTTAGTPTVVNFGALIDSEWDFDQLSLAVLLIAEDGTIDNAGYTTVAEAIENGYIYVEPSTVELTFNYDVTCIPEEGNSWFNPASGSLYVTGTFAGENGWDEPGSGESVELSDDDGDMIYTATITVDTNQTIEYKYFSGTGWSGGEWAAEINREVVIAYDDVVLNDVDTTQCGPDNVLAESFRNLEMYPNPFESELYLTGLGEINTITVSNILGKQIFRANVTFENDYQLYTHNFESGVYLVTFTDSDKNTYTKRIIKQ